jgi:hypothetical protein
MRVPYKPIYFEKSYKRFLYIVIHDYSCRFTTLDKARVDDRKLSVQPVRAYNWVFNNEYEMPYHFVCEKINDDYETIMCTPLSAYCSYPDIDSKYKASVHICAAGNYNLISPEQRAYQQLGYRSVASIMRWFAIPISNIKFHWEISTDSKLHCPGDFFKKHTFLANIKQLILLKR